MSNDFAKVQIFSDGTGKNSSVTDTSTGKAIPEAYAFEVHGSRMSAVTKATIFCHMAALEVTAEAEVIEVPHALFKRFEIIADKYNSPVVTDALAELLGIKYGGSA